MKSRHQTWPTVVTTIGLAAIAALVSSVPAIAQTLPTLSTATPGTVKTTTAPQLVRNVDEPGLNPYEQEEELSLFGPTSSDGTAQFPIPSNKLLVVEHVAIGGFAATGGLVQAELFCSTTADGSGAYVNQPLQVVPQGQAFGLTYYVANQPVKCYATAPGFLSIHIQGQGTVVTSTQHNWGLTVVGYTVPR